MIMQAKTLLETAHSFYLDDSRYKKVWRFNKESEDFDFKEVLQELNMPTGS
jgi:ATP synthase F1 complex assembly factor 1